MISAKYKNLKIAKEKGINVPDLIYISAKDDLKSLKKFLKNSSSKYFIIRSCIPIEDGSGKSYAGHFQSSDMIHKKDVLSLIEEYREKNKKLIKNYGLKSRPDLFVQEYIEANMGGVLFYPWKHFDKHFLVDFSLDGVKSSVEGNTSDSVLVSIDDKYEIKNNDIVDLKNNKLKSELKKLVIELKSIFNFKFDVEWAFDGNNIYLLQIRAVTIEPNAILPQNDLIKKKNEKILEEGNWVYNEFSESMGILSPFSFSLIKYLYVNNISFIQDKLYFKAKSVNFIKLLTNGQVLVNIENYKNFYKDKSLFTAFKRGFRSKKSMDEINNFIESYYNKDNKVEFNINLLIEIFGYYQISIIYCYILNKKFDQGEYFSNEYEASNILGLKKPKKIVINDWNQLKLFLKKLFLYEYDKLKQSVIKIENFSFLDINEYIENKYDSKKLIKSYRDSLSDSIYDLNFFYSNGYELSNNSKNINRILGEVFVVSNPNILIFQFPKDVILIAPYFRNEWIPYIENFKAIILENGGLLSHSAIVAREKNISYIIRQKGITLKFKTGDNIKYDEKKGEFVKR